MIIYKVYIYWKKTKSLFELIIILTVINKKLLLTDYYDDNKFKSKHNVLKRYNKNKKR